MQLPDIRPMTPIDADPLAAAIELSGWGARQVKLRFVARHPECRAFVAERDGVIVGSGVTTLNGPVAWIGTIWVDPVWRGRGLGRALTQAAIEAGEDAGCRALVLVATDAGRPLYERFGFEVQTHYRIVEAPAIADCRSDSRLRAFRADDLPAMIALDAAATGEDRGHLLTALASPDSARSLVREDGTLGGFVVRPPWGGGATIAPDPDDALAILEARRRTTTSDNRRVRAGLLTDNEAGIRRLLDAGWTDAWSAPRMIRGAMPEWRPEAIWGQFDHAVG